MKRKGEKLSLSLRYGSGLLGHTLSWQNWMGCKYACETKCLCACLGNCGEAPMKTREAHLASRVLKAGVAEESRPPHLLTQSLPFCGGGSAAGDRPQACLWWAEAAVSPHNQPGDVGPGLAGSPARKNVLFFPRACAQQLWGLHQHCSLWWCTGDVLCSGCVCACDALPALACSQAVWEALTFSSRRSCVRCKLPAAPQASTTSHHPAEASGRPFQVLC